MLDEVKTGLHGSGGSTELIRLPAVLRMVGVSRSKWYSMIKNGLAPGGIKLGHRTTVWRSGDVIGFVNNLHGGK